MSCVSSGKNFFSCPAKDGTLAYELEDIIAVIDFSVQINQHHFGGNKSHFADVQYKKLI